MNYYGWIENGEITRINLTLPCALDTITIGTAGHPQLLPIVGDEPTYDPTTQRMAGPQYQIDGDVIRRVYTVEDIPAEELAARDLIARKAERQSAIDTLTVTIDGMVFDGDETSQTRMARAIVVMQAASIPTISWVLHDNTVATVTVTQLTNALAAAGAEQARLWVLPYEAVSA